MSLVSKLVMSSAVFFKLPESTDSVFNASAIPYLMLPYIRMIQVRSPQCGVQILNMEKKKVLVSDQGSVSNTLSWDIRNVQEIFWSVLSSTTDPEKRFWFSSRIIAYQIGKMISFPFYLFHLHYIFCDFSKSTKKLQYNEIVVMAKPPFKCVSWGRV